MNAGEPPPDPAYAGSLQPQPQPQPPPPPAPPPPHYGPPHYGPPPYSPGPPPAYPSPPPRRSASNGPAIVAIVLSFVGAIQGVAMALLLAFVGVWMTAWGAALNEPIPLIFYGGAALLIGAAIGLVVGGILLFLHRKAGRICVIVFAALTFVASIITLIGFNTGGGAPSLTSLVGWSTVPLATIVCALLPSTAAWCDRSPS